VEAQIINHEVSVEPKDLLVKLINFTKEDKHKADLHAAKVIVAGGRGCGEEGFELLQQLAEALGAEIAGTRVAVEEGWTTVDRQIGQTGVTVRPELYIACGISGAIQHRAGCLGSRYIVAINRDERAPIFTVSDYAIVGDLFKVVPALLSGLKGGK
jgi:electron transfer flavoprotein alpha subunit